MARVHALALSAVLILGSTSPALAAGPSLGRAKAWVQNLVPRAKQQLERHALERKAARGELREGQLVRTHTALRRADGGRTCQSTFFGVSGGHLLPELVIDQSYDRRGAMTSSRRSYLGNLRRIGAQIARHVEESLRDPDFKAATRGDKAALARYNARYREREARYAREAEALRPKRFVDSRGNATFLEDVKE